MQVHFLVSMKETISLWNCMRMIYCCFSYLVLMLLNSYFVPCFISLMLVLHNEFFIFSYVLVTWIFSSYVPVDNLFLTSYDTNERHIKLSNLGNVRVIYSGQLWMEGGKVWIDDLEYQLDRLVIYFNAGNAFLKPYFASHFKEVSRTLFPLMHK